MAIKVRVERKKPKKNSKSTVEDLMEDQLREAGFNSFTRNTYFIPDRKFQADFLFARQKIVLEVDGGMWLGPRGGHTSGEGATSDRERDCLALINGYITIRVASSHVRSGQAIKWFKEIFEKWGNQRGEPD